MTDLRYCGEIFFLKNLAIRFAACLCILLIPMLAHAIEIEPFTCRNGLFPTEQRSLQIARFNGLKGQKLFFYQDAMNFWSTRLLEHGHAPGTTGRNMKPLAG
jgi:hypothetical protein